MLYSVVKRSGAPRAMRGAEVRRAYSLLELLVVLGIIGTVLAIGGWSISKWMDTQAARGAQEILVSRLGQTRARAMDTGKYCALLIYVDPESRKTATLLLEASSEGSADAAPPRHFSFDARNAYVSQIGNDPSKADRAWHLYVPADNINRLPLRPIVTNSLCIKDTPPSGNGASTPPPMIGSRSNGNWGDRESMVRFLAYERTYLPPGVGAQIITGQGDVIDGSYIGRFQNAGLIVFDLNGRLAFVDSEITAAASDTLAESLAFQPRDIRSFASLQCGIGVVTYDDRVFSQKQWTIGDDGNPQGKAFRPSGEPTFSSNWEAQEEGWLATQAEKYFVSRYSGVVAKAE